MLLGNFNTPLSETDSKGMKYLGTKEGRLYYIDSIIFFLGTPWALPATPWMLRIFLFLIALDSEEGIWNTIMTSTVTPFSSGLWHTRESRVADRVSVLRPGVRPVPLMWESRGQDIGPPETSKIHVISNGERSPRDLHVNAKTQLHSTTSKLQCWTPHAKQLARQEHTTERISDLEDKMVEITTAEQNKEKRMKRIEESLRDVWENIKCTNIWIIGISEEEEKKKGAEKIFEEIIVENFPNMGKEIVKSR